MSSSDGNSITTSDEVEYVGFWARVGASLIDTVAAGVLVGLLGGVLGLSSVGFGSDVETLLADPAFARGQLIQTLIVAAVIVFCWLKFAATPGKRVIGAEVVDAKTFGRLTPGQAILRYACYYVSMIPCFLGFIWVGLDRRKQGWHDKIAGTVVIRKR